LPVPAKISPAASKGRGTALKYTKGEEEKAGETKEKREKKNTNVFSTVILDWEFQHFSYYCSEIFVSIFVFVVDIGSCLADLPRICPDLALDVLVRWVACPGIKGKRASPQIHQRRRGEGRAKAKKKDIKKNTNVFFNCHS
jgi:hypothetical protein